MRAVIQRVREASVEINGHTVANISQGLLILLGIEQTDDGTDIPWLSQKISKLRIFNDAQGQMNQSIQDVDGSAIVVSQFTLHASTKKGNRPSYIRAARPEQAIPIYEEFVRHLNTQLNRPVQTGEFGADMKVQLVNDGPVTIIIDTKQKDL